MNRRRFLLASAVLPVAARAMVEAPSAALRAVPEAYAGRPMMARYELSLARVLHGGGPVYSPEFLLEDIRATPGRRFTNFSGDVSGRWIGALSMAAAVYGQRLPVLDEVVPRVIALQHPEGYFGKTFHFEHPDDDDMALLWGNGRLLVGLMEYHALTHDPAVLAAAVKLGDFLLRIGPKFNAAAMAEAFGAAHFASSYICWTQQTEGLAALYAATKDGRYRDLCAAIAERMERRPADHVHGYLCSVRGTLGLYEATGEAALLRRVEAAWADIMQSGDVLMTGGVPEAWSPMKKRTEGCAESDWLRLNLALWHATGKAIYLDTAEHILFNEFAMNQFASGDFGHARLNEAGVPVIVPVRAWWCCTLHGLRAFPDVHRSVFREAGGEMFYDLPVDGGIDRPGFAARATSRLAEDGTIRIAVERAAREGTLTVRRPPWASEARVARNGADVSGLRVSGLRAGDVVTVRYAMGLAVVPAGDSNELRRRRRLSFGPWLLGVGAEANPGYFNELYASNVLMTRGATRMRQTARSPFQVPVAATRMMCLPAEFPEQPATVYLRAIAEQTASAPMQWEMAFLVKDEGPGRGGTIVIRAQGSAGRGERLH